MKRTYWLIVCIAIVIVFSVQAAIPVIAQKTPFTDIEGNTHKEAIETLYAEGIVFGATRNKYEPNAIATRGETAKMFAKALQLDTINVKNPNFKDVPTSHAYYGEIAALANLGIVSGENGSFRPNGNFKRSHAAKMLTLGFALNKASSIDSKFKDMPEHRDTALYIQTLINYSITQGTTATTFSPNQGLTRGHVATFLYRTMNALRDDLNITTVE
ncbi:S-layer homology domain-containing protein [Caryophanon latum]|uniref:SLH domain-containing protein n=1 Tax=Caryophanon latum TaxID=33977 RepID=A0A1C0YIS6_9BACL|nr:S-layer homology domain-containing protein [Caryophanon latum]OCS87041.1 hypothetical protein A6K76_13995 [Caryophanon latum]